MYKINFEEQEFFVDKAEQCALCLLDIYKYMVDSGQRYEQGIWNISKGYSNNISNDILRMSFDVSYVEEMTEEIISLSRVTRNFDFAYVTHMSGCEDAMCG